MARKNSTISLAPSIYNLGQKVADEFYGGNLSAYISFLIVKDNKDKIISGEAETKDTNTPMFNISQDKLNTLNSMLNDED